MAELKRKDYDPLDFGAVGDGKAVDTIAVQRAIDTAADRGGGRVLLRGGKRFLLGALVLKSRIELHLADDVVILASTTPSDYGAYGGLISAEGAEGVRITGTGDIDGQAMKFMTTYSTTDERWEPMSFRPRMFSLKRCTDLEIHNVSFGHAPYWVYTCSDAGAC